MNEIRMSPSAISNFKACPMRRLLGDIYGLQLEKEKDSTRIGGIWHRTLEILGMVPQSKCPLCLKREEIRPDCYLCDGRGILPIDLMDSVVRFLNWRYETVPEHKTHEEWEIERIILLYSLSGYRWHYADFNNKFQTMVSELRFDLPIINPGTNKKIGKARSVGKIDEIIKDKETGLYYIRERKSTSTTLEGTKYWERLQKDIQITDYLYSARIMQMMGQLEQYGIKRDDPLIQGIWYDVWHKPKIEPKFLTQADSKTFVETSEYCGEKFNVILAPEEQGGRIYVNELCAITTTGKKEGTFSIFETPEMFGARLLQEIAERPEYYFQQREISRTDQQLEKFESDLIKMVQIIRHTEDKDLWYENEGSCDSPYRCDFKGICYGNINIDPDDCPEGFVKWGEK